MTLESAIIRNHESRKGLQDAIGYYISHFGVDRPAYLTELNMLVPFILMAGYAYEVLSVSIMSDAEYDNICRRFTKEYDQIEHQHKHLIPLDIGSSTTASSFAHNLPLRVTEATKHYIKVRGIV